MSILGPDGKPVDTGTTDGAETPTPASQDQNLLIFTDKGYDDVKKPYQAWQEEVDRLTPKGIETFDSEKGFEDALKYDGQAEKTLSKAEREGPLPWSLPPNFCPYCNRNYISTHTKKARGMWIFVRQYEGLGIKPGDKLEHYACLKCLRAYVEGDDETESVIHTDAAPMFRSDAKKNKAWVVEERLVAYVQSRFAVGDRNAVFGDETRKERFAEKTEEIHT